MNVKTSCFAIVIALGFLASLARADKPKKYAVNISRDSVVAGEELQAGDYNLVVDTHDPKVLFRNINNGNEIKVEAKIEEASEKYDSTMIHFSGASGTNRITEIRFAGTKTRVVFE